MVKVLRFSEQDRQRSIRAARIRKEGLHARGRYFTPKQIDHITRVVAKYSAEGRTKLSERICQVLRWYQPNGALKDMACREVLRQLDSAGVIALPAPKWGGAKWANYSNPKTLDSLPPTITSVDFARVNIRRVESKMHSDAPLWNSLVSQHHYLHSSRIVGRQLKYIASYDDAPIACLGWGDCAWSQSARDSWIGWSADQRTHNRHLVINNCRFLILPWVKIPNLASFLIARCSALAVRDWHQQYSVSPLLLETFVDSHRFLGTCYRAANWVEVGRTSGFAKVGNSHHNSQSPKLVFLFPLKSSFRAGLSRRGNRCRRSPAKRA